MPERPLLLFPTPELASRIKRKGFPQKIHKPDMTRQGIRLPPMFHQLQQAISQKRIEVQATASGIEPEFVLVIETIGSVDDFSNAVKRVEGLEWMGEIDSDEIMPNEDFYLEENPQATLSGKLFLIMSNQVALSQLLSLWNRYQQDPGAKFDHGLAKFKNVFDQVKIIRPWDIQDRLFESGIIEYWRELCDIPDSMIPFEIELWFRNTEQKRSESVEKISRLLNNHGGSITAQCVLTEISYFSIMATLPVAAVQDLLNNNEVDLIKCDSIMYFRPVGQISAKYSDGVELIIHDLDQSDLPELPPVIALFDGLPLSNHDSLRGRIIIDDPDGYESEYQAQERVHGTAMASLIIHGDLEETQNPLQRNIYLRPIMKPHQRLHTREECIPDDVFVVDLIHRAVKRLFEGENGEPPIAPTVKFINLSVGDYSRHFHRQMSPWARLLDWLSYKYKVLFLISAGNHATPITMSQPYGSYTALQNFERQSDIVLSLIRDLRNRKILSPSESINNLTIGAIHDDLSTINALGNRFDPFESLLPSPISAFGTGYRNSIKPDLVFMGGKQLFKVPYLASSTQVIPANGYAAPGQKVASPGVASGTTNSYTYSRGTSNATALITRNAGVIFDATNEIFTQQNLASDYSKYSTILVKALLVHGCSWGEIGENLKAIMNTDHAIENPGRMINRWIGYGFPTISNVLNCDTQRVTVIGYGDLSNDQAHIFRFPLPSSLSSRRFKRRLSVTLSCLSPVRVSTQRYRDAQLWFELTDRGFVNSRKESDARTVRKGTLQHEIFEGIKAEPISDNEIIEIKVNCKEDAGKILNPISYGLVVTLEISPELNIDIYTEVATRIRPSIRVRQ